MITTHVLDTVAGAPRAGLAVTLERQQADGWAPVGAGTTDADGRLGFAEAGAGTHRLTFATGGPFHPEVIVVFTADAPRTHVPLLLAPYGYTTYRGS